jgi:hypothetical protein
MQRVLSALLMLKRVARAFRYAALEAEFAPVVGAAALLLTSGTLTYMLLSLVDALYFAVATVTTTSVSDPDLVLEDDWMKLFTIFYQLIGIGILVEIVRRLGAAFVLARQEEAAAKHAAGQS